MSGDSGLHLKINHEYPVSVLIVEDHILVSYFLFLFLKLDYCWKQNFQSTHVCGVVVESSWKTGKC